MKTYIIFFIFLTIAAAQQVNMITGKATNWIDYPESLIRTGVYIDVDLTAFNLAKNPLVFTSLAGVNTHWIVTGMTSIYNLSPKGFRVYLKRSDQVPLTKAIVTALNYTLMYQVIP